MHRAYSTMCWSSSAICCALLSVDGVVVDFPGLGRLATDRLGGGDEHAAESTAMRMSPANTPGPPQCPRAELRVLHFTIALLAS